MRMGGEKYETEEKIFESSKKSTTSVRSATCHYRKLRGMRSIIRVVFKKLGFIQYFMVTMELRMMNSN